MELRAGARFDLLNDNAEFRDRTVPNVARIETSLAAHGIDGKYNAELTTGH